MSDRGIFGKNDDFIWIIILVVVVIILLCNNDFDKCDNYHKPCY